MKKIYSKIPRLKFLKANMSVVGASNSDRRNFECVPSMGLKEAMLWAQLPDVDVLHVNASGRDWDILRHLEAESVWPSLIVYEHKNMTPEVETACKIYLLRLGYEVLDDGLYSVASKEMERIALLC